jgi:hypothetical protein
MNRHHNIFGKDENGNSILLISPLYDDCFCCNYLVREYNFTQFKKTVSVKEGEYLYYLKFEYELDVLGNDNLISILEETLVDTLLRTSPPNRQFIESNDFGLYGYYHTHPNNFLYSSLSFELVSTNPFPYDLTKEISIKVKNNYYMCDCEFSYGSYVLKSEERFIEQQTHRIERSLSLLKTDKLPSIQMDRIQCIVTSGITHLSFRENKITNSIIQDRIQVFR